MTYFIYLLLIFVCVFTYLHILFSLSCLYSIITEKSFSLCFLPFLTLAAMALQFPCPEIYKDDLILSQESNTHELKMINYSIFFNSNTFEFKSSLQDQFIKVRKSQNPQSLCEYLTCV